MRYNNSKFLSVPAKYNKRMVLVRMNNIITDNTIGIDFSQLSAHLKYVTSLIARKMKIIKAGNCNVR